MNESHLVKLVLTQKKGKNIKYKTLLVYQSNWKKQYMNKPHLVKLVLTQKEGEKYKI